MVGDEHPTRHAAPSNSQPPGRMPSPLVAVPAPNDPAAAPDPVREVDPAQLRLEAKRIKAMLDLRSRQLEEGARRESAVVAELRAARAAAREREEEAAGTQAEMLARTIASHQLQQQLRSLVVQRSAAQQTEEQLRAGLAGAQAELERALHEADAQRRVANARGRQLSDTKARLRDANGERRVLAKRAAKLEELRASRGYRVLRIVWRIEGALLRPFRALRRSAG